MFIDKRDLNQKIEQIADARKHNNKIKLLTTGAADLTALELFFYKNNYVRSSPFNGKNVLLFYGDGPYTKNIFIDNIYLYSKNKVEVEFKESWGWEALSKIFYVLTGGENFLSCEVRAKKDEQDAVKFLVKLAGPSEVEISESSDIIITREKTEQLLNYHMTEIPVERFIPAIDYDLIKKSLPKRGKTAFVTIGGAEHNIYLNYAINMNRKKNQVLFDKSNNFDLEEWNKIKKGRALLTTHNYVGVIIKEECGREVVLARGEEKSNTGGVIIKISSQELFETKGDLIVVFGSGPSGALATKLTLIRILLKDSRQLISEDGIYYVVFDDPKHKDIFMEIYKKKDVFHTVPSLVHFLQDHKIRKAESLKPHWSEV